MLPRHLQSLGSISVVTYASMQWMPSAAKHTPPAVARGISEAIAIALRPRRAPCIPSKGTRWFVDAAPYKSLFVVGLWGPEPGYQI